MSLEEEESKEFNCQWWLERQAQLAVTWRRRRPTLAVCATLAVCDMRIPLPWSNQVCACVCVCVRERERERGIPYLCPWGIPFTLSLTVSPTFISLSNAAFITVAEIMNVGTNKRTVREKS